jgi:hypothetical protein
MNCIQTAAHFCTDLLFRLQASLQYFTWSQFFSHFLRQVIGRLQTTQILKSVRFMPADLARAA